MSNHAPALTRRTFLGGFTALGAAALISPATAFAATAAEKQAEADAVRSQLVGLQADLEAAAETYYKALEEQDAARSAMQSQQEKIDETTNKITKVQGSLSTRARSMYRSGSTSFFDFVMGAASFEEFAQNWDLLNQMNENDGHLVEQAKTLRNDLETAKAEYARQEQLAASKATEAQQIQANAQAKMTQATELMNTLDAEARQLLDQEQAAAAAAAAAQAAAEQAAAQPAPQGGAGVGGSGGNGSGGSAGGAPNIDVPSNGSIVDYAYACIGTPYVWGGHTPGSGMDCSGFVEWCYAQVGISVPHYTESMYAQASWRGPVSAARPGDILYRNGHCGIAVTNGGTTYVHSPTFGAYVRDTDPLSWANFTHTLRFG